MLDQRENSRLTSRVASNTLRENIKDICPHLRAVFQKQSPASPSAFCRAFPLSSFPPPFSSLSTHKLPLSTTALNLARLAIRVTLTFGKDRGSLFYMPSKPLNTFMAIAAVVGTATAVMLLTLYNLTQLDSESAAPPPVTNTRTHAAHAIDEVRIFLVALEDRGHTGKRIGCDDSIVPVTIAIEPIEETVDAMRAALEHLFAAKENFYGASGLYNALYQSEVRVESAIVEDGIATVYLSGTFRSGGVCDDPRIQAQIEETILQFPEVAGAKILLNGSEENWQRLFDVRGE